MIELVNTSGIFALEGGEWSWAPPARRLDRAPGAAQDCLGQRGIAAGIGVRVTCAL